MIHHLNLDEYADSFRFLARANGTSEWLWKMFFVCTIIAATSVMMSALTSILLCRIINGSVEVDQLYHPYRVMLVKFAFPLNATFIQTYEPFIFLFWQSTMEPNL